MDNFSITSAFNGYSKDANGFSISEITDYELVALSAAQGEKAGFAKAVKTHMDCAGAIYGHACGP